jgi:hypothetical protein
MEKDFESVRFASYKAHTKNTRTKKANDGQSRDTVSECTAPALI